MSPVVRAACCPVSVARLWRSEAVVDKAEVVLVGFDKEEADVRDLQDCRSSSVVLQTDEVLLLCC